MKNTNQSLKMGYTSFLFAATLFACNTIVEPVVVNGTDSSIDPVQPPVTTTTEIMKAYANGSFVVVGDTIVPKRIAKLPVVPSGTVDLTSLKNKLDATLADAPLRMVSIGGSLASGMRDGGLTQESQLTSYPNLIARQMKLASFKQPLFGDNEYNGFGYKLPKPSNTAVPRFNAVKNNTAFKDVDKNNNVTLNKFEGNIVLDNYAAPHLGNIINSSVIEKSINSVYPHTPYLYRFNRENTIKNVIASQKYDIVTIDSDVDYFIRVASYGSGGSGSIMNIDSPFNPMYVLLNEYKKNGTKVLMANIPDISDFPYYNAVTLAKIQKATQSQYIYYKRNNDTKEAYIADESIKFLPNSTLDSLMDSKVKIGKKGLSKAIPLEPKDVFTADELINLSGKSENDFYDKWLQDNGFPYVDLHGLYKKIIAEAYISHDGAKVSSKEFFSTDGINPTALGQAIIANEFIKTMNTAYKSNIPLINIAEYKSSNYSI
jgi:hypothetical protein